MAEVILGRYSIHCSPKGITKRYTLTKGGSQELTYINEPNLYRLIIEDCGVRVIQDESGEPWFVAVDITRVLGYSNGSKAVADKIPGVFD